MLERPKLTPTLRPVTALLGLGQFERFLIWWMGGMLFTVYHHAFRETSFQKSLLRNLTSGIHFTSPAFFRPLRGHFQVLSESQQLSQLL